MPSIVPIATAVPAFVGYTENSVDTPLLIDSLAAYERAFGRASHNLHASMQLFYANGGGTAYVVSAGTSGAAVDADALVAGVAAVSELEDVTILAVPDAVLLPPDDFAKVVQAMVAQCTELRNRVAILDVYGGASVSKANLDAIVAAFGAMVPDDASYAASYLPFLVADSGAIVPPSGAVAGVYARNDANAGVWKAPANIELANVTGLTYRIDDKENGRLMLRGGKAVNAIRHFPAQIVVWGARTMDGNSETYRYIQCRRTIIYIERSIEAILQQFVFAPNNQATWSAAVASITSFLTTLWSEGCLVGSSPSSAFAVQCGVGTTMTADDLAAGLMNVTVAVALQYPAEFTVLTFTQPVAASS